MNSHKKHTCRERKEFEVLLHAYPHVIFRCSICRSPIRSIPIDDLNMENLDLACEMIARYKARKRG